MKQHRTNYSTYFLRSKSVKKTRKRLINSLIQVKRVIRHLHVVGSLLSTHRNLNWIERKWGLFSKLNMNWRLHRFRRSSCWLWIWISSGPWREMKVKRKVKWLLEMKNWMSLNRIWSGKRLFWSNKRQSIWRSKRVRIIHRILGNNHQQNRSVRNSNCLHRDWRSSIQHSLLVLASNSGRPHEAKSRHY